ncbi:MAG TPA: serine/threonine-protein kinase [Myxococcaceae bacterium]|jgi:serine/threonine protein kinase
MDTPVQEAQPVVLPPGTKVGAWRVHGIRGGGTYGTVYRAVAEERTQTEPAALKLAVYPGDARFEREVELLSRIRHPSVPRLLDAGLWHSPRGVSHPFVVMEWVEGEPLYAWAARRNPSSRQVLRLLAQAAGALQATHEVSAVHRDVKGDNMLVRPSDGRLFLTDLGAGYFAGASRLTPLHVVPGTAEYRSPELWQYAQRVSPGATAAPLARPVDDVFALGVTAYRLVTDLYPPFPRYDTETGQCSFPGGGIPPPRRLNPRIDAQLNALISRMLSPRPEERGSAGELAEAMERGVAHAGPSADAPLFEWETLRPWQWTEAERADAEHLGQRPRHRSRERALEAGQADAVPQQVKPRHWLPWLAAVLALGLWPAQTGTLRTGSHESEKGRDAVSLGEAALNASVEPASPSDSEGIRQEFPKQPFPDQVKPDARGRCPKRQLVINGGCWLKVEVEPDDCPAIGVMQQGECYVPVRTSVKVPAAAPPAQ